ncbi:MAG: METTL5 family protein [Thermoplasmata archaeon]|jgi:putative methylase|nr:METTL5 family protein [Thermoplasmata archaeon]
MKKRQLEITLQRLEQLGGRSAELEQYVTPADVAADMLWEAFGRGDIEGKAVADLGCGNGVFVIGAKLLGASKALGVDIDKGAVSVASRNAESLGLDVEIVEGDVSSVKGRFDTVIQNPPFGAQRRHADRSFIKKALEIAPVAYSLHNDGSQEFVGTMVSALGGVSEPVKRYKFEIPYAFEFHRKAKESISVILLRFKR